MLSFAGLSEGNVWPWVEPRGNKDSECQRQPEPPASCVRKWAAGADFKTEPETQHAVWIGLIHTAAVAGMGSGPMLRNP